MKLRREQIQCRCNHKKIAGARDKNSEGLELMTRAPAKMKIHKKSDGDGPDALLKTRTGYIAIARIQIFGFNI